MADLFILKRGKVVPASLGEWAAFVEADESRVIGRWDLGSLVIHTTFRGIADNGTPPRLFETYVWGGAFDGTKEMYFTMKDAQYGHERMIERVAKAFKTHGVKLFQLREKPREVVA